MRNLKVLSFALLMGLFIGLSSCGSSKEASVGLGLAKEKSPAQIYWEANTKTRAYANGTRLNESVAANIAESDARAKMARSIEVSIRNFMGRFYQDYGKSIVNATESKSVYDVESKNEELTEQVASMVLRNISIAKYDAYLQKNGETTVHLCLEYSGGEDALADAIVKAVLNDERIKNQLSDDEKAKINQNYAELKKRAFDSLSPVK